MVKIALDTHMYHASMSVADQLRKTADLGYEYVELSPRADWFFWHRYPKADDALIAETKKAMAETGVKIHTLVPVYNWSSPDEQERRAHVRNWKRLLEIAADLECPIVNSELSGDPNRPGRVRARVLRVHGGADPRVRAARHRPQPRGAPVRLLRDQRRRGADHPRAQQAVGELRVLRPARLPSLRRGGRRAADDGVRRPQLQHLHIADCWNHRANIGNRYIINPPGVDARIHQHNEIGNGEVNWDEFFATLRDVNFDGVATVCVFGWEEEADAIHRRMLERVKSELRV